MWAQDAIRLHAEGRTTVEIGARVGVSRERVRQVLKKHGISTRRRGGQEHRCRDACALVLAASPPVSIIALSRASGLTWTRINWAVRRHKIPTTYGRHVCDDRCETLRAALATGLAISQAARRAGFHPEHIVQRFPVYHPDWNWSRLRRTGATTIGGEALRTGEWLVPDGRRAQNERTFQPVAGAAASASEP